MDTTYILTYDMTMEVLAKHREEIELFQKKLAQKTQALNEGIATITQAFPHISFDHSLSCFHYLDKVDDAKLIKAREIREAAVSEKNSSRMGCDCCLLL